MKDYIRMWCVIITTRNPQKWFENLRYNAIYPGHIYFVSRKKWNIFVTFNDGSVLWYPCRHSFHPSFANFPEFLLVIANWKILPVILYLTVMSLTRQVGSAAAMETIASYGIRCQKSALNAASVLDLTS